jgi:hypothetical protein
LCGGNLDRAWQGECRCAGETDGENLAGTVVGKEVE